MLRIPCQEVSILVPMNDGRWTHPLLVTKRTKGGTLAVSIHGVQNLIALRNEINKRSSEFIFFTLLIRAHVILLPLLNFTRVSLPSQSLTTPVGHEDRSLGTTDLRARWPIYFPVIKNIQKLCK